MDGVRSTVTLKSFQLLSSAVTAISVKRSGWPQPKLDFFVDQDDEDLLHRNIFLGNQVVFSSRRRSFKEMF